MHYLQDLCGFRFVGHSLDSETVLDIVRHLTSQRRRLAVKRITNTIYHVVRCVGLSYRRPQIGKTPNNLVIAAQAGFQSRSRWYSL